MSARERAAETLTIWSFYAAVVSFAAVIVLAAPWPMGALTLAACALVTVRRAEA